MSNPQTTKSLLAAIERLEHRLHETVFEANACLSAIAALKHADEEHTEPDWETVP